MARSASRKLLDELPSSEEMAAIMSSLKLMDDATVAMMSAAYLDHALELLLKSHFRQLTANETIRLFDGSQNAILGTFSVKIRVAFALGLLMLDAYTDLLLINDIRNAFAHSLHRGVDFLNEHIRADCDKLTYLKLPYLRRGEEPPYSVPIHLFIETVQLIYSSIREPADRKRLSSPHSRRWSRRSSKRRRAASLAFHRDVNRLNHLIVVGPLRDGTHCPRATLTQTTAKRSPGRDWVSDRSRGMVPPVTPAP